MKCLVTKLQMFQECNNKFSVQNSTESPCQQILEKDLAYVKIGGQDVWQD